MGSIVRVRLAFREWLPNFAIQDQERLRRRFAPPPRDDAQRDSLVPRSPGASARRRRDALAQVHRVLSGDHGSTLATW